MSIINRFLLVVLSLTRQLYSNFKSKYTITYNLLEYYTNSNSAIKSIYYTIELTSKYALYNSLAFNRVLVYNIPVHLKVMSFSYIAL
jgi:hypothetical protein